MKCPKCSFISFDYNDACPKCGKDLTNERDVMGLPSYKPKPLAMLAPSNAYTDDISGDMTRNAEVPLAEETIDDVPEELLISLDDLSDDEPLPVQIESDPTQAEPEQKIDDEMILDVSLPNSEEAKSGKDNSWDLDVLEEKMPDSEFDDTPEKTPVPSVQEETPGERKEQEPLFELEIEPLEFDLDPEEPDKKTS